MLIFRMFFLTKVYFAQQIIEPAKFERVSLAFHSLNDQASTLNGKAHTPITCGSICLSDTVCHAYSLDQDGSCHIGNLMKSDVDHFEGFVESSPEVSNLLLASYFPPALTDFSFVMRIGGQKFTTKVKRSEVEIFDLSGQQRTCRDQVANLPAPLLAPSAIFTNGTVFYCGGGTSDSLDGRYWLMFGGLVSSLEQQQSFEIIDLYQMKFVRQESGPIAMPSPVAVALNESSYAIALHDSSVVVTYNMDTNSFARLKDRPSTSFKGFFGKITLENGTEALIFSGDPLLQEHRIQLLLLEGRVEDQLWQTYGGIVLTKGNVLQYQDSVLAIGGDNDATGPYIFDAGSMTWKPLVSNIYEDFITHSASVPLPDNFCDP